MKIRRARTLSVKVSIVIPVLNEAINVRAAIDRAWAAGADDVVIVDGGSIDGTAGIARLARCRVFVGERGRGAQLNLGARHASGDVLLFLHADSWLAEHSVQQVRDGLRDDRVAGGAFCHRIAADGFIYRLIERGNAQRVRWFRMAYGDQGIFLRRDIFEDVGGFPEVALMEDVRLMRKLRARNRLILLPGPLHTSARRWQQHGAVRQTLRNWWLRAAEAAGVSPDRLLHHYPAHSEAPDECLVVSRNAEKLASDRSA